MAKIIEMRPASVQKAPVYAIVNIPCYQPAIPQVRKERKLRKIGEALDMVLSAAVGAMLVVVLAAMLVAL